VSDDDEVTRLDGLDADTLRRMVRDLIGDKARLRDRLDALAARPTPAADDAMVTWLREDAAVAMHDSTVYQVRGQFISADSALARSERLTAAADRLAGLVAPPVTPAGTDFRTWKRENLERLAVELLAGNVRLRERVEELEDGAMDCIDRVLPPAPTEDVT
jgi:hypothetical protein